MEVILALPFILLPLSFPVMAGYMAKRFGRSFGFGFGYQYRCHLSVVLLSFVYPTNQCRYR